jgi:nicotinamide-nucleotide adenylyltransferase
VWEICYNLDMKRDTNAFYFSPYTIQRFERIQFQLDQLEPEAPSQALVVPGSPIPERNIVVFPGSFNPPTAAHIALLQQAWQFARVHGLMRIYAALSTHITDKERVQRPLLLDRINLLETVLSKHVRHTGIMLFNRGLYVEQAEAVHRAFPQVTTLYFLIGFDKIVQIFDPHYYQDRDAALDELFELADFFVAPRGEGGPEVLGMLLDRPENRRYAGHVHNFSMNATYRDISSTRIREGVASHEMEIPSEVRRFIRETHVYEPPLEREDGSQIDQYGERIKVIESTLKSMNVEK